MRYDKVEFQHLLNEVMKPGRYTNNELNSEHKTLSSNDVTFCFAYPDVYEVGFSHLGIKILYELINNEEDAAADRVFAPWEDFSDAMQKDNIPLFALESKAAVKDFDVLGFTLQSELTYSNILFMLDLADIELLSKDRDEGDPLIIAGGPSASNPEPLAMFMDAVLIGEGEEAIIEIKNSLKETKALPRSEKLKKLSEIEGVYVPSLYILESDKKIKIRKNMHFSDDCGLPQKQLVPWIQPTHDRLVSEIMRGCSRGCRFCHAGFFYRPVREKNPQNIIHQIEKGVGDAGWEEVALTSLSSSDYTQIRELLFTLEKLLGCNNTSLSLPSLRVDSLDERLTKLMNSMQQTGMTIAPEAGSQRLRDIINKNITEEEILKGISIALANGWRVIKLYFMIGLPFEEWSDIEAIIELVEKIIGLAKKKLQINITVSPFVPKPFTPFQWAALGDREELLEKSIFLKQSLKKYKFVKLKYHTIENQLLECILGRGDKSAGEILLRAYKLGAKFDGWNEYFDFSIWEQAAKDCNLDISEYTRKLSIDEPLPWDHIEIGVSKEFLLSEYKKAESGAQTPDCRDRCTGCGLCGEEIKPVYKTEELKKAIKKTDEAIDVEKRAFRVWYKKDEAIRFIGHLDLLRMAHRLVRKSGLNIAYSEGYNRHPLVSFGPPLPLGMMSETEYFDLYVRDDSLTEIEMQSAMKDVLPRGMIFKSIQYPVTKKMRSMEFYDEELVTIELQEDMITNIDKMIEKFHNAEEWEFTKTRKRKLKVINLKSQVRELKREASKLIIQKKLTGASGFDILEQVFGIPRSMAVVYNITREKLINCN